MKYDKGEVWNDTVRQMYVLQQEQLFHKPGGYFYLIQTKTVRELVYTCLSLIDISWHRYCKISAFIWNRNLQYWNDIESFNWVSSMKNNKLNQWTVEPFFSNVKAGSRNTNAKLQTNWERATSNPQWRCTLAACSTSTF